MATRLLSVLVCEISNLIYMQKITEMKKNKRLVTTVALLNILPEIVPKHLLLVSLFATFARSLVTRLSNADLTGMLIFHQFDL